jgi:hypothetical protein
MKVNLESLAAQLSLKDVRALVKRKERALARVEALKRKRDKLLERAKRVEEHIEQLSAEALGAKPRRTGRKGKKGGPTLSRLVHEYLGSVSGPVNLNAIVDYVNRKRKRRKATLSQYNAVCGVVRKDSQIKKVSRGIYRLATGAAGAAQAKGARARKKGPAVKKAEPQPQEAPKPEPAGQP